MSTNAANYLQTTLSQGFSLSRFHNGVGIRVRLIFKQLPAGVFTFTILSGAEELASVDFTAVSAQVSFNGTTPSFSVDLSLPVKFNLPKGSYTLRLSSSGYAYSSGSWVAWCKTFEPDLEYDGVKYLSFSNSAYFFKILEERQRGLKYDY